MINLNRLKQSYHFSLPELMVLLCFLYSILLILFHPLCSITGLTSLLSRAFTIMFGLSPHLFNRSLPVRNTDSVANNRSASFFWGSVMQVSWNILYGLDQTFHPWSVHCHLLHIPNGLGSNRKDREWRQNRDQPPLVQEPERCRKVVCEKSTSTWHVSSENRNFRWPFLVQSSSGNLLCR